MCQNCRDLSDSLPNRSASSMKNAFTTGQRPHGEISSLVDTVRDQVAFAAYYESAENMGGLVAIGSENRLLSQATLMTFTPADARRFAAELLNKADEAEAMTG